MASLTEAYDRIQNTIAENNQVREQPAFQELFGGVYQDLQNDLKQENIDKPLSDTGQLVDYVTGFRKKQIEDLVKRQTDRKLAIFDAEKELREKSNAELLNQKIYEGTQVAKVNATNKFKEISPGIRTPVGQKEKTLEGMREAVQTNPELITTITDSVKNNYIFKILKPEQITALSGRYAGHTFSNGDKLYATGGIPDTRLFNARGSLTDTFQKTYTEINSEKGSLEPLWENLPNLSEEKQLNVISGTVFQEAFIKTLQNTKEAETLVVNHSNLSKSLNKIYTNVDRKIQQAQSTLKLNIRKAQGDIATLRLKIGQEGVSRNEELKAMFQEQLDNQKQIEARGLAELKKLNFNLGFVNKVKSTVLKQAFAMSLADNIPITTEEISDNLIQKSILILRTSNSPVLENYRKGLEIGLGKISGNNSNNEGSPTVPTTSGGNQPPTTSETIPKRSLSKPIRLQ